MMTKLNPSQTNAQIKNFKFFDRIFMLNFFIFFRTEEDEKKEAEKEKTSSKEYFGIL